MGKILEINKSKMFTSIGRFAVIYISVLPIILSQKSFAPPEREVCKDLGEICGYIGPGIDSTCCNNMECTTNGRSGIGAAFTCEVKEQEREVCKDVVEICGYIGPGIDGTCQEVCA